MTEPLDSITVTGQGTVQTAPDFFNINIGIEAQQATVREAYARASEALNAVNAKLLSLGVAREVISSSSLDVRADTRWQEGTGSVVTGYTVSSTLSVALRYDQGAQDVIAAVVDTGNNNVRLNGLTPVLANPAAAQDAARAIAWADALRAAGLYAQLAGRSLGAVKSVLEGAVHDGAPRPMMAFQTKSTDSSMAIEPGQSTVSMSVQVTWQLA
ncbi:MAG: SIMPL domain-containing protein [Specibacter sp.]